jgi:hypothetical protein
MRAVLGWCACARRAFGHGMPCPYWKKTICPPEGGRYNIKFQLQVSDFKIGAG